MDRTALNYLVKRTANLAIGNSTLRNQGASGLNDIAREFLSEIDLWILSREKEAFRECLDRLTEDLRVKFPTGAKNFGAARKAINIYLRDCLYNRYIYKEYRLDLVAVDFEVPLDSHVAKGLGKTKYKTKLPKWDSIKRLTPEDSDIFQACATSIAEELKCNRVDLDIYLWRRIGIDAFKNI
jgi:hypothetical protein